MWQNDIFFISEMFYNNLVKFSEVRVLERLNI